MNDFTYVVDSDDYIEKARGSHKYLKREGSPGNYRYFYKMPDGSIQEGDAAQQEAGKLDHMKRLLIGREQGHHAMTDAEISRHVGGPADRLRQVRSNMHRSAQTTGRSVASTYERHHIVEAHADPNHPSYAEHADAARDAASLTPAPRAASATPRRPRRTPAATLPGGQPVAERQAQIAAMSPRDRRIAEASDAAHDAGEDGDQIQEAERAAGEAHDHEEAARSRTEDPRRQPGGDIFTSDSSEGAQLRMAHRRAGNNPPINASGHPVATEAARASAPAIPAAAAPDPEAERKVQIKALRDELKNEHGVNFESTPAPAPAEAPASEAVAERARAASRAAQAAHPDSNTGTPAARALSASDPDFGASEAEIQRAVAAQAAGHNPYLHRAVEIFHRIRGDIKPERRELIDNFFKAHDVVQARGEVPTRENVLAAYKALPGNRLKRTLPAEDVERGTFHTMDEMFDNPPLNPEVERMKRGYAAKQFQRLKPFLKDSWHAANPPREDGGPPPPMPTWGDLKSWSEHEGPRPAWAPSSGRGQAVPEEVHAASVKGADGKPQYPPAWMPIHLMPVWNYIVKSSMRDSENPYEAAKPGAQELAGMSFGNQATRHEGKIISSLRKYIQMRGGPEKLIDIPSSKLAEAGEGFTHRDIFKSDMSDAELKKLITMKIIDPVGLTAILKKMMKTTKKSFELFVDADDVYIPNLVRKGEPTNFTIDLRKSEKIRRIREILIARGR